MISMQSVNTTEEQLPTLRKYFPNFHIEIEHVRGGAKTYYPALLTVLLQQQIMEPYGV